MFGNDQADSVALDRRSLMLVGFLCEHVGSGIQCLMSASLWLSRCAER